MSAFYSVISPEPSTPAEVYAKALAQAAADEVIGAAFVAAKGRDAGVGILDKAIEAELPKGKPGTAAKAVLANLRELFAAIPVGSGD